MWHVNVTPRKLSMDKLPCIQIYFAVYTIVIKMVLGLTNFPTFSIFLKAVSVQQQLNSTFQIYA